MKLIHLSDLHLGKRVNEFSMLEDQQYILTEILQIIDREKPDGVMIAGDVYDKSVPSAEAVALLEDVYKRQGVRTMRLLTNNPDKVYQLSDFGLEIAQRVPIQVEANKDDIFYLRTKQRRMGHLVNY